ncbi:hypothetical protein PENTCL1PPCAC_12978, partial [Pristionchus entomophagus]
NKKNLEFEVQLKSTEIEYLKKSEAELKTQLNEMKSEVKAKSEVIENLKKSEAKLESQLIESMRRISLLEGEIKSKPAEIENNNLKMSQEVPTILEKVEASSINLRRLHDWTGVMTLRARVTEISKLASSSVFSQWTEHAGMKWRQTSEFIFVVSEYFILFKRSCLKYVELQLISQKNENIVLSKNLTNTTSFWCFDKLISFGDLFDEEKGYVKDDSIIVAAVIRLA